MGNNGPDLLEQAPWIDEMFKYIAKNPAIKMPVFIEELVASLLDVKGVHQITMILGQFGRRLIDVNPNIMTGGIDLFVFTGQSTGTATHINYII